MHQAITLAGFATASIKPKRKKKKKLKKETKTRKTEMSVILPDLLQHRSIPIPVGTWGMRRDKRQVGKRGARRKLCDETSYARDGHEPTSKGEGRVQNFGRNLPKIGENQFYRPPRLNFKPDKKNRIHMIFVKSNRNSEPHLNTLVHVLWW